MAKISIRIDISPEISIFYLKISIFLPSADAPFSLPLSGRTRLCKENAPVRGPMSMLITLKFVDCCKPLASLPHYRTILFTALVARISPSPHLTSLVQTSLRWTSVPLILNATEVKIGGNGGASKLIRQWRRDFLLWEKISIRIDIIGQNIDIYRYKKKSIFAITTATSME